MEDIFQSRRRGQPQNIGIARDALGAVLFNPVSLNSEKVEVRVG
jgi:hypothetical protein